MFSCGEQSTVLKGYKLNDCTSQMSQGYWKKAFKHTIVKITVQIAPPIRPSRVLFGDKEIREVRPNVRPIKYANMSFTATALMVKKPQKMPEK